MVVFSLAIAYGNPTPDAHKTDCDAKTVPNENDKQRNEASVGVGMKICNPWFRSFTQPWLVELIVTDCLSVLDIEEGTLGKNVPCILVARRT